MSTIFRTYLNWPEEGPDMEVNTEPSMTQPDMVMSLEDLLNRSRNGQEVPTYNGIYDDDEESFTPDARTLDFVDFDEMLEKNKSNIDTLKTSLDVQKAESLKKKSKTSVPKQQSDEGATDEGEAS